MSPNRSRERVPPPAVGDEPPLSEEEAAMMAQVNAIMPEIDEDDPEWQAYVREAVQEALDDPRPSLSSEEVRQRLEALYAADRASGGRDL